MTRFATKTNVTNYEHGKSLHLMTSAACDQDLLNSCVWAMGDAWSC